MIDFTTGSAVWYYIHQDALGNVVALSNNSGNAVESYAYTPFGTPTMYNASGTVISASAVANPYLFTGRRYDEESGLYYYRYRMYNPQLGRFMRTDPIGYYVSMILYQYCGNNPVNWIDPWGLSASAEFSSPSNVPILVEWYGEGIITSVKAGAQLTGRAALAVLRQAGVELTLGQKLSVLFGFATISDVVGTGGGAGEIGSGTGSTGSGENGNNNGKNCNKDIEKEVNRFKKRSLKKQKKEYENLKDTYEEHLNKYNQNPGQTSGEVDRIRRQLEAYEEILRNRGVDI